MDLCLDTVSELGQTVMSDFDRRVASIPQEMCAPFYAEAQRLEVELLSLYRMAAACARNYDEIDQVATLWGAMEGMCEDALEKLKELNRAHPTCGADTFYDRIGHIRNKCQRLQKMHA